jgi:hypothetical protein
MIFDGMNQRRLRPGHSLINPICPFSTSSQAAAPSPAVPSAAKIPRRPDAKDTAQAPLLDATPRQRAGLGKEFERISVRLMNPTTVVIDHVF